MGRKGKILLVVLGVFAVVLAGGYVLVMRDYPKAPQTLYFNGNLVTMAADQPKRCHRHCAP